MAKIRHRFQPLDETEMSEQEAKVLEHQGLLWDGTDEELAALYTAAGLEVPADLKPKAAEGGSSETTASPAAGKSTSTQAKGA